MGQGTNALTLENLVVVKIQLSQAVNFASGMTLMWIKVVKA